MKKEAGIKIIEQKVQDFEKNALLLKKKGHGETNIRTNYIDVLFEALGWDMKSYYDVVREYSQKDTSATKKVDYAFKINGKLKFFVEAKEASVDLINDKDAIYQAKRYAYSTSGKAPIVILTDFEAFRVFNVIKAPDYDNTDRELLKKYSMKYSDYLNNWELLWDTFSKEAVGNGSLELLRGRIDKNTKTMDVDFLEQITDWRETLAKNVAIRNKDLSVDELNEAVQRILDRLLFIRNLEDREIEPENTLLDKTKKAENIYKSIIPVFNNLDNVYNGLLFKKHFSEDLNVDDKTIKDIIKNMCYPVSPFQFDVIEPEILGRIYEKFLGSKIRLTENHQAKVEEKIEVRKAGGVYYTPEYIVTYIVENTVGKKIEGLSPEEIKKIKIVDPACGSGSFLLGAYSYILAYHAKWYASHKSDKAYKADHYVSANGDIKVSLEKRGNILRSNIFGVDIDQEATEVAIMSLYLKMLDDGFDKGQKDLFFVRGHVLPDMADNVKCGNSLIGTDYFDGKLDFGNDEFKEIKPFDWEKEFVGIFNKKEKSKFHLITFETKYSRESNGNDAVLLGKEEILTIINCFKETKNKYKCKFLACSILPDHVHVVVADMGNEIEKIVNHLKGYSAFTVNRTLKGTVQGEGRQLHLWSKSYNNSFLDTEEHLFNAIEYVNNNWNKHSDTWDGYFNDASVKDEIGKAIAEFIEPFTDWKDYEYNKGGFDVVIGNPPYVRQEMLGQLKPYFQDKYNVYHGVADLYQYFIERAMNLMNVGGYFGYIVANKWTRTNYGEPLRQWLKGKGLMQIIDFGDLPVFQAVTTYPCILISKKETESDQLKVTNVKTLLFDNLNKYVEENSFEIKRSSLDNAGWDFSSASEKGLLQKIKEAGISLEEYVDGKIYRGILTGLNEAFVIDKEMMNRLIAEDAKSAEMIKPFLLGKDIKRYSQLDSDKYLILFPKGWTKEKYGKAKDVWEKIKKDYPAIALHLSQFEDKGKKRYDKGEFWWELRACDYYPEFERTKIIYPNICKQPEFTYDENKWYTNQKCFIIALDDKYLLALLNSGLFNFLFSRILPKLRGGFYEPSYVYLKNFSIKKIDPKNSVDKSFQDEIIKLVEQMLKSQTELHSAKSDADKRMSEQKINMLDKKIDELVYKLYDLTDEEIKIVEGS